MNTMARIYARDIHTHFSIYYANWPPGKPVELGDFGIMEDCIFDKLGNINDIYDIEFTREQESLPVTYEYSSSGSVEIKYHAAGELESTGKANAGLEINFSSENAVYFNVANCVHHSIENKINFSNQIMDLFEKKKWELDYVVVTSLIESSAATVLISGSGSKGASISLEASNKKSKPNDLLLHSKSSIKLERNIGFKAVAEKGLKPLLGVGKIRPKWAFPFLLKNEHVWRSLAPTKFDVSTIEKDIKEQGGHLRDAFYFGQLY